MAIAFKGSLIPSAFISGILSGSRMMTNFKATFFVLRSKVPLKALISKLLPSNAIRLDLIIFCGLPGGNGRLKGSISRRISVSLTLSLSGLAVGSNNNVIFPKPLMYTSLAFFCSIVAPIFIMKF
jgi:hypothetical protein